MQQNIFYGHSSKRAAAINGLAVVGFITLVLLGVVLAIYAARYVPTAISRLASAAVYLSTGTSGSDGELEVVPNLPFPATPTAPAGVATTTSETSSNPQTTPTTPVTYPTTYETITTPYPTSGSIKIPVTGSFYGLPNLVTTITAVGYVDNNGIFHEDKTITSGQQLAVQFRVKNEGTNESGEWRLHATLPTKSDRTFEFESKNQEGLVPGGWIDFTIHIEVRDVRVADDQKISIVADSDEDVKESNENDNDATATVSVEKK